MRPFEAIVGIGVIVAIALSAVALWQVRSPGRGVTHGFSRTDSGGDSPITVVGGSITIRSKAPWSANPPYTVSVSDTSRIELAGVEPVGPTMPTGFANITGAWTVTLSGFMNPSDKKVRGVTISSMNATSGPNDVTLGTFPDQGATFYADDADLLQSSRGYGKRFRHNGCNPQKGEKCEHMQTVTVKLAGPPVVTANYTCTGGECLVYIGK